MYTPNSITGQRLVRQLTNKFALLLSPSAIVSFQDGCFSDSTVKRTRLSSAAAVCQLTVIFRMFLSETQTAMIHGKCSSSSKQMGEWGFVEFLKHVKY